MPTIRITSRDTSVRAKLNESATARQIWAALPIEARAQTWGDEVYFSIPVQAEVEADARAAVEVGELGYWPSGSAFCIFFGPTPASSGEQPVAASPVNILGEVEGDATIFRAVKAGDMIRLERADE